MVEVTQFIRFTGKKIQQFVELEEDLEEEYEDMKRHNCRFEAEVLETKEVSLTIWDDLSKRDIDEILAVDTKDIRNALGDMLKKKNWLAIPGEI